MTFKELSLNLAGQKANNQFAFDLKTVAPNIIKDLENFFDLNDGIIELKKPIYSEFTDKEITITSTFWFKKWFKKADVDITVAFFNNMNKIEYVISVEPEGSWGSFIGDGVVNILHEIGANLDNTIFYFTSLKSPIELEFDDNGDKLLYEVIPNGVYNVATHFKNEILEDLGLKDNLFQINPLDKTISKKVHWELSLLDIIAFEVKEIIVHSSDSITIRGDYSINLMPEQKPIEVKNGDISLALDLFTLQAKVPNELMISNELPGIKVWNVNIKFGGSLIKKTYTYGAFGNFGTKSDKSKQSSDLESNNFELQYSNLSSTPVPALFDGKIKELTFSKGIEMLTGVAPGFPKFIDDVLSFNDLNIYWCDQPGFILRSGEIAPVGFGIFSEFKLLGIHGYTELNYYQEAKEVKGLFLVEPISIPHIIEIGGNSEGHKGKVKPGGMQFDFRVDDGDPQFESALKVKIFDKIEALNATSKFNKNGISFSFKQSLPFAPASFKGVISKKGDIDIDVKLKLSTPKIQMKVEPFGKIKISFSVGCAGKLVIRKGVPESFSFDCTFKLFGKPITIPVKIKTEDLEKFYDLPTMVLEAIKEKLKSIFNDTLAWLKGIVHGVIDIANNLKDQALIIAQRLKDELGNNAKMILDLLKKAEVGCKLAYLVISKGLEKGPEEVAKLLKESEFKVREIASAIKEFVDDSPKEILKILRGADFTYKEIGKAFSGMSSQLISYAKKINLDIKHVTEMLNGMGKSTDEAVKILTKRFDITDNKALVKLLKEAKFDASQIEKSFRDILHVKVRVKKPSGKIFGHRWSL
ncbi:MAG: hypothetical protein JNK50_05990 [Bacteroidia bacterium]|nr:hypothetical protein [Bacteroidia bacterium]